MALSDELTKLAARAKQAEDRVAAAQQEAHAKLQTEVQAARDSLDKHTDQLRETAESNRGKVAQWWNEVQKSWDDQIASIRRDIEAKKAQHDLHAAQRRAAGAEEDAEFAINLAYWAVEEAEWAALDATLAQMEADTRAEARA
jgi:hypothetical protein